MEKLLQQLKTKFLKEEYSTIIKEALPQRQNPVFARLICLCYIKSQNYSELSSFLQQNQDIQQFLQFEKAYCDYCMKQDAQWFLKVNCQHPMTANLKAQICYRSQYFGQASAYYEKAVCAQEDTINLLAAGSRSSAAIQITKPIASFEYYYNLAVYQLSRCQFHQATQTISQAKQYFGALETEDKSQKDEQQLLLLEIIAKRYMNQNVTLVTDDFMEELRIIPRILNLISDISVKKLSYENIIKCCEQFDDASKRLFILSDQTSNEVFKNQIKSMALSFKNFVSVQKMPTVQQLMQFPQILSAFSIVSKIAQGCLPNVKVQRRFKKNPEAYVEYHHYESLKRISLLEIPNLDENVNIMASSLLRCLGLPADSARFEPMSKQILLQRISLNIAESVLTKFNIKIMELKQEGPIYINSVSKTTIREKKPMPLKWQKKKQRGKKDQKHQGAHVNDKLEVSKVVKPTIRGGKSKRL